VTPRFLRVPAAEQYSGMSRAGIYRNLATGKIEGQKDGRTLLIDRESLDRYLESLPKAGGKVTAA